MRALPVGPKRLHILLMSLCVVFLFSCSGSQPLGPKAVNGVIDLANVDVQKGGSVELGGEWKFKWMETKPDFADPGFDDSSWNAILVPSYWDDSVHASEGYGWFRLKVKNLKSATQLALFHESAQTAERVFVNGKEIMHAGSPGETRANTRPAVFPQVAPVNGDGDLVIAILVSNFHYRKGGLQNTPELGSYQALAFKLWFADMKGIFIVGLILMMFLYNLILWLFMREEKANLNFALFCLMAGLFCVFRYSFIQRLMAEANAYEFLQKAETIALLGVMMFFLNFIHCLFEGEFSRRAMVGFNAGVGVGMVAVLVLPTWAYTHLAFPYVIALTAGLAWFFFLIVKAVINKREYAKTVLAGVLIFLLAVASEIAHNLFPVSAPSYLLEIGTVTVIASYAAVLSSRFAHAFTTSRRLTADLQKEVDLQTEELENQVREKTDLFINFNHETKTPLTLISNYLDKAQANHPDDPNLPVMRRNLDKLIRDVNNSLDLEKLIRQQDFYRHDKVVSLSALLQEKAALFGEMAKNKGIDLAYFPAKECPVRIDPFALDRILNNLLDNAIKYTPSGGRIALTLDQAGSEAILTVEDTGLGIPADKREAIFKPYHQISRKKSNAQGLGMGLSIVKRIMDGLGGNIALTSEEGQGTAFILRFPLGPLSGETVKVETTTRPQALEPDIALPQEGLADDKPPLLIVEDNPGMLAFLTQELSVEYNVYRAASGREALRKLESMPTPRLILSDVMMDQMDGFEFLDALARSPQFRNLPLVFLTAKAAEQDRLEGLSRGAVDVIAKPFSLAELRSKIRALIQSHDAQRDAVVEEIRQTIDGLSRGGRKNRNGVDEQEENFRRLKVTPREREIVLGLIEGLQYKELSDRLGIALGTLKSYVVQIYRKCGVQNKVELINIFKAH